MCTRSDARARPRACATLERTSACVCVLMAMVQAAHRGGCRLTCNSHPGGGARIQEFGRTHNRSERVHVSGLRLMLNYYNDASVGRQSPDRTGPAVLMLTTHVCVYMCTMYVRAKLNYVPAMCAGGPEIIPRRACLRCGCGCGGRIQ